mgnify:FL=1
MVAAATIVATAGLTAFVPSQASAAEYGDLIMGETLSTVYYYGSDGQRYSFPNEKTYFSWFEDFDGVVEISDEDLADITLAGNIVYRQGSRWVKITSDEKTYAVAADGSIHWIESEEAAEGLAGSDWNEYIDDVPDVFFVDYTVGDSLTSAEEGYYGMLWTDGDDTYLVWDGEVRLVSDMDANMFQDGFVLDGDGFDMDSLTEGDEIDSELAYLTDAGQMVETDAYAETQEVEVSLSDDSPSSSTLVAAQGIAHLASYDFENNSSSDVVVTKVVVSREGVSADTTLSNSYLFDGWVRLSDSATVSSGSISWNDSSGLFTIPAGETATVAIRSYILTATSGQTVGVSLDPDDVEYSGAFESTGSALDSDVHTIATVSNFGTVSFATSTTPSANTSLDPQDDFSIWNNTVTIGNNEAYLYALRFRNIGSINEEDLGNWRLYVAGINYGDAVEEEDDNGYVAFDLSADPVKMNTGNHIVKVLVDIWGGSTRTVTVGLRNTADAIFVEEDYDQPILVQANSTTFSARDAGAQTIATGNLTFTKKSDSPSGDVVNTASNVSLATFEVKATGEAMKVESLNFNVETTVAAGNTAVRLRNGAIYVDGTQVGSTSVICGNDTVTASACTSVGGTTASYSTYTFGSSFIVYAGSPVTMDVHADVFDSDGTNQYAASDTIRLDIDATALSSNVLRMVSGGYTSLPGSDVSGNSLTVRAGTLTTAQNTIYAAQSAVAPKTEYKIGSWTVTANTTEDVNLTQIDIDFGALASDASAAADYSNVFLTYGPDGDEVETSAKSSVSLTTGANSWSVSYNLEAGETIYVNAYATVATSVSDDTDADDIITSSLTVDGTTVSSGATVTGTIQAGQAITWYTSGTFSTALGGDTPVAKSVAGGQTIEAAKYKLTAVRDTFTVDQIAVSVLTVAAAGVISKVELYDGSTLLGSAVFNQTNGDGLALAGALVTGLDIEIAAGSSKTITAKLVLNDIGSGAASSQNNLALSLDSARNSNSSGTVATDATDRDGNEIRAYNSIPTFSGVDLTNSTVVNGQPMDLYKFTVSANSNGTVALKQLGFPVSWTDSDVDSVEMESWKLYKNGADVTSLVLIQDQVGATIESTLGATQDDSDRNADGDYSDTNEAATSTIYVTWSSEEVVSAGETVTYVLRATPRAFDSDGDTGDEDFFSIYLGQDTTNNEDDNSASLLGTEICLNDGTATTTVVKLNEATAGACEAAEADAINYNVIWSDSTSASHATATNASSSTDWAFGYLLLNLDLSGETWSK